ncbi:AMP-binding protein [Crenobacter cavernae]|uniref:Beta-hydroxyacyl-ACP dehydratase n=1 Tax=Crenobacter cavernae TaxID=2290923 RepID=A0A345Y4S0_9NEIS|nr:AMP-binding protein [Crenobacter cavernae]AXK38922.1 beta-hydroxyacyl-ACP dehydratase [Crenobacter cavernae]
METAILYPLIAHDDAARPLARFAGRERSAGRFLADVAELAERLPERDALLNACQNRYLFAVVLYACALRGKLCLLPASHSPETIHQLAADYPALGCLSDRPDGGIALPTLLIDESLLAAPGARHWPPPSLPAGQRIARVFTSGSTGRPQGHDKYWGALVETTRAGMESLGLASGFALLGTVPAQHMYGLESTLLLPLLGGGLLSDERPFYPADVQAALAGLPAPRVLVSTPFHLRTLLESGLAVPELTLLTSATAPLSGELAGQLEGHFGAPLLEIYGCTETGQLATRRSALTEEWECMPGVELRPDGAERAVAHGGHVWQAQPLNDRVELYGARRFRLLGRTADLVNVAGKRSSLAYLTQQLLAIPGVADGVFFLPEEESAGAVVRLAALVVAPKLTRTTLLAALRQRIDAAFLPRPLKFAAALPRNTTGKLPLTALRAALHEPATDD